MATIYTVCKDYYLSNYRAKWCLEEDTDAQWFHPMSHKNPTTEEAAKQDVLAVKPDAVYLMPERFEEEIAVAKLALENGW